MIMEAIIIGGVILGYRNRERIGNFIEDAYGMVGEQMEGEFGDKVEAKLQHWCDKIADRLENKPK